MDKPAPTDSSPPETDSGLLSLLLLARLLEVVVDPRQLRHDLAMDAQPFDSAAILRAAKRLGLKGRQLKSDVGHLARMPLPAIAQTHDGRFMLIVRHSEGRYLIQETGAAGAGFVTGEELAACWNGDLILIARRRSVSATSAAFGWRWFMPAIHRYRKFFAEVLVASFFLQLLALATPLFFQVVVDKVLAHGSINTLQVLAVGLLAVSIFEVILTGLRNYLLAHTSNRIDVQLGARLFNHLLALPVAYFESRRVGHSVARVRELETLRNFITGSTVTLVMDLLFTFVFFGVLFHYSTTLAWVVLASVPAYVLLSILITPVLRQRLDEKFSRGAENQAFLVESISGLQTLKSCAVEPRTQRHWEDQLAGYVRASFRANNLANAAAQVSSLISKLTTVGILWLGAVLVIEGAMTVGQLVAFNMIAGRISGPILKLVSLWQEYQQAGISIRRLGDILDTPRETVGSAGKSMPSGMAGRVEFQCVSFRYRPDRPEALREIDLRVEPGELIGIVGRSGSGKSTLTKLIQRMYVPERGRILLDDMDLGCINPAWLRRQIGVVLQDSFLFNRSVRENIALADPGLSMDSVIRAARLAGAHEFIQALPDGYDTIVEEQGANFSGGQKQRIAIARALIGNPRILIFDEATSALDYESEKAIHDNMDAICANRTVFIIAHRLSAVRRAHRILVMDNGRIVETGSHEDLVAGQGHYARLHEHQHGMHLVFAGNRG